MIIFNHLYLYPPLFLYVHDLKGSKDFSVSLFYYNVFMTRK